MSENGIRLANDHRLASEQRTRVIGGASQLVDYQEVSISNLGSQPLPLSKYMTNASSVEMAVDGTTPVNFDLEPSGTEIFRIEKLVLVMVLVASPTLIQFGDQTALTNGLSLKILDTDDVEILDLLDGQNIKSNNDLATIGTITRHVFSTTYTLKAVIQPSSPIRLEVPSAGAEKLRCTVSDNLSAITRMRMMALGRQEDIIT